MPRVRFVTVTASSCLTVAPSALLATATALLRSSEHSETAQLKRVPNRSACFSVFDAPPPALCWYFRQPESATTTTPHTVVMVLTLQLEIASTISGESFVSGPQLLSSSNPMFPSNPIVASPSTPLPSSHFVTYAPPIPFMSPHLHHSLPRLYRSTTTFWTLVCSLNLPL
ncbi:hypothetical protein Bca4012_032629 [Brassica carinata]|uniref:Secreted protein n=1 Tax=Brassica carinata TaxID=52824 RepID=A0A8X7RFG5_BRACI|nr:hypothetical protein Bca52824_046446 [Brassica carinata]